MPSGPSLTPARSSTAAIAVLVLVGLAGVAVYGVITVARSTPLETGAAAPGAPTATNPATLANTSRALAPSDVLAKVTAMSAGGNARPEEIIALLQPSIEANPDVQELRVALAHAYYDQKDWASAYKSLEAAIAIGPESAALQAETGTVANAAGLLDRSIEHYSRAKQLDPSNPIHPLYLGMVQVKAGKDHEAMASFAIAAKLNPDLAEAWGSMGELELRNNQLDIALTHIQRARGIQPESLKWRLAEAKAHKRQNEPAKSLDLLANLPEKQRYNADVIPVIADSLAMLKQAARRAEYLQAAADFARKSGDQRAIEQLQNIAGVTGGK